MLKFIDIQGPVGANTVYVDGHLVSKDTTFLLPEVTPKTTSVNAMGDMDVMIIGQLESMEATIKKIGIDLGLGKLCKMETHNYELRWTVQVTKSDGGSKTIGCKAFLRGFPKKIMPGLSIENGSPTEGEIPIAVTRYQLYADGEEVCCIDRLAQVIRIDGKDYFSDLSSLL